MSRLSKGLRRLSSAEIRAKHFSNLRKRLAHPFSPHRASTPVFICGLRRSGTTMLNKVFHLHSSFEVWDESPGNELYERYRIRSLDHVAEAIDRARTPFVAIKAHFESHLIEEYQERFPDARFVWALRNYKDAGNSQLRRFRFRESTRSIRNLYEGGPGLGWFGEGLSEDSRAQLLSLDPKGLSDFDLVCLIWWARNRVFLELGLKDNARVRLLAYEEAVTRPEDTFTALFRWLGAPVEPEAVRFVHASSISRDEYPAIDATVARWCDGLAEELSRYRGS